jgi:hypothetical protein
MHFVDQCLQRAVMCKNSRFNAFCTVCKHIRVFALLYKSITYKRWHDSFTYIYVNYAKNTVYIQSINQVFQGISNVTISL